ncbi:MAG: hypothetical protein EON60_10225 [Alphaproteobacteria bacterium]|nr:MAG: hypothetical protein EON60_10225 [Alphaproteobacteria bacterium]
MKMKTSMLAAAAVMIGAMGMSAKAQAYDGRHDNNRGREVHKVVVKQVYKQPVKTVKRGGLFDRLDMNNNGAVSKWEYTSRYGNDRYANRTFARLDVNRDGKLNQREVAAGRDTLLRMRA